MTPNIDLFDSGRVNTAPRGLQQMRTTVADLNAKGFRYPLVHTESFVRGMRDSGYKGTDTALDEFIDNSVEAGAQNVWIVLGYDPSNDSQKKPDVLAVVDDGHGIDPDGMRLACLWGGTSRMDSRSGFGRYGFGLPSAAVSISRRFHVFSCVEGAAWHRLTVDLDAIARGVYTQKDGGVAAPTPEIAEVPGFIARVIGEKLGKSGTVVMLDHLDRLGTGFRTSASFKESMAHHLGVTYRGVLRNVRIHLVDTAGSGTVETIEPIDPLFTSPFGRYYEGEGLLKAEEPDPIRLAVKFTDSAGKVREGAVIVRFSYLPPGFQNDKDGKLHKGRHAVMKANNGVIIMRAGRQIDVLRMAPSDWELTFQVYDYNWKVVIDFDPELDELFGITVNKQQARLTEEMWDRLKSAGVKTAITALRARYRKDAKGAEGDAEEKDKKRASEKAMEGASRFKTRKTPPPSPERQAKDEERLDEEVKKRAAAAGKPPEAVRPEVEAELKESPYRVMEESLPGAPFYRIEQVGGQKRLLLNRAHRFYTDVYRHAQATPRTRASLELLLFVLGEGELEANDERARFYEAERAYWSTQLGLTLDLLDKAAPLINEESVLAEDAHKGASGADPEPEA